MTTAESSIAFGNANSGLQVGQSFAPISAEFHLAPERLETPPLPCSTVPLLRDPNYVSRKTLLDEVEAKASVPRARIAVVGLGGTGKTQLAVEYADLVHARSPDTWIIWISAHNAARVQQSAKDVADRLKIRGRNDPNKDPLELLKEWLGDKCKGKWLVFLDNFDDIDVPASSHATTEKLRRLTEYFPVCDHGSVIITTRSLMVARKLVYEEQIISVEPMSAQHASELLEKNLGPDAQAEYQRLATALDFIPLAISQAAAYIRQRGRRSSVHGYLQKIEKSCESRTELLRRGAELPDCTQDSSRSVITTWQISFDYISEERRSAADLLSLMSMCDRHAIPECILRALEPHDRSAEAEESSNQLNETDEGFEDDIAMLIGFSFISTTTSDTDWTMHRLVQDATRSWIEHQGRLKIVQEQFIDKLCAVFPSGQNKAWQTCQSLLPHVHCARKEKPNARRAILRWAEVMHRAGEYSRTIRNLGLAANLATISLDVILKHLGKDDERTMEGQYLLAKVLRHQHRFYEAEMMYLDLLETSKAKLGAETHFTLRLQEDLATTYGWQERWEEANTLQVAITKSYTAMSGADHPDTLDCMRELATSYMHQGRSAEAEKLLLQVTEMSVPKLEETDYPWKSDIMHNLAHTYCAQERFSEAEALFKQGFNIDKADQGTGHPNVRSMIRLAAIYYKQGRLKEAEALQVEALRTSEATLGPDHVLAQDIRFELAMTYIGQKRLQEAYGLQVETIEMMKAKLGSNHWRTLVHNCSLALTCIYQRRYEEAETILRAAVKARIATSGSDHFDTLATISFLARACIERGQFEEAETLSCHVVERYVAKLGWEAPRTLNSMVWLVWVYYKQGRWEKAEELSGKVAERCRDAYGQEHSQTLEVVSTLEYYRKRHARTSGSHISAQQHSREASGQSACRRSSRLEAMVQRNGLKTTEISKSTPLQSRRKMRGKYHKKGTK